MGVVTQVKFADTDTGSAPTLVNYGGGFLLAWTKPSGALFTAVLIFGPGEGGIYLDAAQPTGFTCSQDFGPAVAVQGETVWLAWLEDPGKAPFEPPSTTLREPPVIMVSSSVSDGPWSTPKPLWNPGLFDWNLYVPSYAGPAAVSAPALVANGDEIIAVWIEMAVNGSDALELWSGGVPLQTPSPQVFMAKLKSGVWSARTAVSGALSFSAPALAAHSGTVYMAFNGQSGADIYFMTYTNDHGWSKSGKLPNFQTLKSPALATKSSGEVQMVWLGASSSDLYRTTFQGTWDPNDPGHGWSAQIKMPVIASSAHPALASQVDSTDLIPVAFKGASSNHIWVVPLSSFDLLSPAPRLSSNGNYQFGDNGNALKRLLVEIEFSEDFVLGSDGPASGGPWSSGYSFQLNALSTPGYVVQIQQFVIELIGSQLQGTINNWPYDNNTHDAIVNTSLAFANVPTSGTIPKGYKLNIGLDQLADGTVTGANFSAFDQHGHYIGGVTNALNLGPGQMAPIIAFEMNIVGPFDSEKVTVTTGKGTLTFKCDNELTPSEPTLGQTEETSNIEYQALTAYPATIVTQNFGTTVHSIS